MSALEAYFKAIGPSVESVLSEAVEDAFHVQAEDPLRRIASYITRHVPAETKPTIASLRRFLCAQDEASQEAKRCLSKLQEAGHATSRACYLKALSEIIGSDPRPPGWNEDSTRWRACWRDDWRRMYLEYQGLEAEPEMGWEALEAVQRSKLGHSVTDRHENEGWVLGAAEAYTWLSSVEARNPMARALREGSTEYAAATYALCSALEGRPPCPSSDGQPCAFRNLLGQGGLIESDAAWERLETPDRYGFRGLTSSALVRPTKEARYFDERGFLAQVAPAASPSPAQVARPNG
jgi:hypothetical protein